MSIMYATSPSDEEGWTDLYAIKDGAAAKIAVLKTANDGSILDGITLPTVTSSFVRSTSDDPGELAENHLQILS